jgi:hypothetical protein
VETTDTYMVLSGYDGRVIASGLTEKQLDALMAKFVGANCPPPRWKRESK